MDRQEPTGQDRRPTDRWTELLLAAGTGDRHALAEFVVATEATVRGLCHQLGDPDSCEDLAQEVYCRALGSLGRFRQEGSGRSWLLAIARNTCADATRRRIRHRAVISGAEPPDVGVSPEVWVEEADLLSVLKPDRREAFVLTQLLGLSYAESADLLGCPIGTVRSRVSRARSDLLSTLDVKAFSSHPGR